MLRIVWFYLIMFGLVWADSSDTAVKTVAVTEFGTLKVGTELPSFNGLTSVSGRLSSRTLIGTGNVVVVSYAATWCQPCRNGIPIIERVVHADDTVQAVYIALDKESFKVQRWAADLAIQSPVIVDKFNAIAKRHGVVAEQGDQPTEIPLTIIVNEKGLVTQILTTEGTDFELKLREAIADAQNTYSPQTGGSHPVGSSDQKRSTH
jgi:peroxiredoxin